MHSVRNPYRTAPGSEPPEFAGRAGELGAARYALDMTASGEPAKPIVFVGLRGMGKTALLRHVAREAQRNGAVTIVGEADRSLRFATVLRSELAAALKGSQSLPARLRATIRRTLDALPTISFELPHDAGSLSVAGRDDADGADAIENDPLEETLTILNDQVHRHGRYLAIGIDELQESPPDDLRRVIRVVHQSAGSERPILFLGAGLPDTAGVLKAARTYTERWAYYRLELLNRAETFAAADVPARALGVAWTDDALEALYALSAGYPYFLQEFASASWLHRTGVSITAADVAAIAPGVQRMLDESVYDRQFAQVTPREAAFVLALRRLGPGPHRSEEIAAALNVESSADLSSVRTQLIRKEIIYAPGRGLTEFRMPLTDRYVTRNEEKLVRLASLGSFHIVSPSRGEIRK